MKTAIFCVLFLFFTSLFADFDFIDEDDTYLSEHHLFSLSEDESDDDTTEPSRLSASAYFRYLQKTDDYKSIVRFSAKATQYDLKALYQSNTANQNEPTPYGVSLKYTGNSASTLVLGQYQISHGYGLLLSRGSFISEKPSFSTDFRATQTALSANARPFYSHTFFGAAYQRKLSEYFTAMVFSSYKGTGARVEDDKIIALQPNEPDPKDTVTHSYSGAIIDFRIKDLHLSTAVTYSHTDLSFDEKTDPVSASASLSYKLSNFLFFSETAHSQSFAHLSGIKHQIQTFSQMLVYRYYSNDYHADYANYIRNTSSGQNEQGLFYKVTYKYSDFAFTTYADIFDNIEANERYLDKNTGTAFGVKIDKYSLFAIDDMSLSAAYRQKQDKDWRNFTGVSKYHDRKREYYKVTWQQTDSDQLSTKLVYDYQRRKYPEIDDTADGYTISTAITLKHDTLGVTFIAGFFDTEIPLYLYLYSGKLNNPLYVLTGEGQYALLHSSIKLANNWQIEAMGNLQRKEEIEYATSLMVSWKGR